VQDTYNFAFQGQYKCLPPWYNFLVQYSQQLEACCGAGSVLPNERYLSCRYASCADAFQHVQENAKVVHFARLWRPWLWTGGGGRGGRGAWTTYYPNRASWQNVQPFTYWFQTLWMQMYIAMMDVVLDPDWQKNRAALAARQRAGGHQGAAAPTPTVGACAGADVSANVSAGAWVPIPVPRIAAIGGAVQGQQATSREVCLSLPIWVDAAGDRGRGGRHEGREAVLRCPPGLAVRKVNFASWGAPLGRCGSFGVTKCNAKASVGLVERRCLGKRSCRLPLWANTTELPLPRSDGAQCGWVTSNPTGLGSHNWVFQLAVDVTCAPPPTKAPVGETGADDGLKPACEAGLTCRPGHDSPPAPPAFFECATRHGGENSPTSHAHVTTLPGTPDD
jgi:hypothetical protein